MPDSTPPTPALAIRVATRSDVGMRRSTNQDALAVAPAPDGKPLVGDAFLMVADGMGAHAAGELASKMAVDAIPHAYLKSANGSAPSALRGAIREANEAIHAKGGSSPDFAGMGTTCSCLVATQGAALIGHVGDSRVYRLRVGVLEQLTFDHSLVWEMAAASNVSADKVPSCIPKNVITRSLGPHASVNVDLEGPHALLPGDTYLLCSDGLTGVVDDTLAGGILDAMDPDDAADTLINVANLRGGPDNITVIVARVENVDTATATPPESAPAEGWQFGVAAAAICLAVCAWSFFSGHVTGMLASAAGLGAAIAYSYVSRAGGKPTATSTRLLSGQYGNGPYRRTECGDRASAAGELQDLVRELSSLDSEEDTVSTDSNARLEDRRGLVTGGLLLDWTPFRDAHQQAEAAYSAGQHGEAIALYASIIRDAMRAIRDDDGTHRFSANSIVR